MRIAYLECFSGVSGDMFLGALIDAGVPPRLLEETVAVLNVGARLEISRVWERRRQKFTPRPSRKCTFTKLALWMPSSTSYVRPWGQRLLGSMKSSALP